jgi:acyl carrier protein
MREQLRRFIVENFQFGQATELSDDASLQDAGIIDSTGVLELVTHLEVTYGVSISDEELLPENLDSINRLIRFLQDKLRAGAGDREPRFANQAGPQPA